MAVQSITPASDQRSSPTPYSDLSFDVNKSDSSVLELVYWIRPKWRDCSQELKIVKFTEGITNTVCPL